MRKLIWVGILTPLAVFCFMNAACGGYSGWPGKGTDSGDAKVVEEVSVMSTNPLENGLWTYYVNYDKTGTKNQMKSCSTYRDGTAPFGVFTSDGNLQQHFNDHVGVKVATAYDTNGDGTILFEDDYSINDGFCPVFFGTADPDSSDGFSGYCDKGNWETLVASDFFEESKQTQPGSRFSNVNPPTDFAPVVLGRILASGTPTADGAGVGLSITGLTVNGAVNNLAAPVSISAYGMGHALAIDANQASLKAAAGWLADQLALMPNGQASLGIAFNGGAVMNIKIAAGPIAAVPLRTYASRP